MYYIYTIEGSNGVYVGSTQDPMSRMYSHAAKKGTTSRLIENGRFFLRHQFETAIEAHAKEAELIESMGAVNLVRGGHLLGSPISRKVRLFAKVDDPRAGKRYVRPLPCIREWANGKASIYYGRRVHSFSSVEEAQLFVEEL